MKINKKTPKILIEFEYDRYGAKYCNHMYLTLSVPYIVDDVVFYRDIKVNILPCSNLYPLF